MQLLTPEIGVTTAMRGIMRIREELSAKADAKAASTSSAQPVPVMATPFHPGKFVDFKV